MPGNTTIPGAKAPTSLRVDSLNATAKKQPPLTTLAGKHTAVSCSGVDDKIFQQDLPANTLEGETLQSTPNASPVTEPNNSSNESVSSLCDQLQESLSLDDTKKVSLDSSRSRQEQPETGLQKKHTLTNPSLPDKIESSSGSGGAGADDLLDSLAEKLGSLSTESIPEIEAPEKMNVELKPHQRIGVGWMAVQEDDKTKRGGILGDDMGLGKTIQALALMLTRPPPSGSPHATLVVAPLSVVSHWKQEVENRLLSETFNVLVYYGPNRTQDPAELAKQDLVITTYGLLTSEWCNIAGDSKINAWNHIPNDDRDRIVLAEPRIGALFRVAWRRVFLDEAHTIRNRTTKSSRAAHDLVATNRWCLTGTPIQNRIEDLYAFLRFLRIEPYCDERSFRRKFPTGKESWTTAAATLKPIMLRREKKELMDAGADIQLPEQFVHMHFVPLPPAEQFYYDSLAVLMATDGIINAQDASVFAILASLLRLRQATSHPAVTNMVETWVESYRSTAWKSEAWDPFDTTVNAIRANQLLRAMSEGTAAKLRESFESNAPRICTLCGVASTSAVIVHVCGALVCCRCLEAGVHPCTQCSRHITHSTSAFHRELQQSFRRRDDREKFYTATKEELPTGHTDIYSTDVDNPEDKPSHADTELFSLAGEDRIEERISRIRAFVDGNSLMYSAKMLKILRIVQQIHKHDPTDKCVVFSEHLKVLYALKDMLAEHSFGSLVFEGKNTTSERDILLESFASDVSCNVLLVSKKAGGTGLNLIAANHVIIESLWWNPAVDAQAVDRVYRIGQKKNVHVHRLVASDTIDEAMYIIQGRKADMIEVVLGKRDVAKNKKLNRADVISLINNI